MAFEAPSDVEFVEYIVKSIVDNPDAVIVNRSVDEMGVLIELTVDPADMGKIIGKEGQNAQALRTLLRVLGAKQNARVNMKILEPEGSEAPHRERPAEESPEMEMAESTESAAEESSNDESSEVGDDVPTDVLV